MLYIWHYITGTLISAICHCHRGLHFWDFIIILISFSDILSCLLLSWLFRYFSVSLPFSLHIFDISSCHLLSTPLLIIYLFHFTWFYQSHFRCRLSPLPLMLIRHWFSHYRLLIYCFSLLVVASDCSLIYITPHAISSVFSPLHYAKHYYICHFDITSPLAIILIELISSSVIYYLFCYIAIV